MSNRGLRRTVTPSIELTTELTELKELDRPELRRRYEDLFGSSPSLRLSRKLLIRAIAFQRQCDLVGGLEPKTRRQIKKLAETVKNGGFVHAKNAHSPRPGTRLLRRWRGETHEVLVLERGCVWRGKRFNSLSALAEAITGAKRSGPAFFGLRDEQRSRGADGEA